MEEKLLYSLILIISVLFIYLVGGPVIIFASLIVIFEKCVFGRVNVVPGIEFTTLATILVTLSYGWVTGILFCIFVPMILPSIINSFIGEKGIVNPGFVIFGVGFGNMVDIICVLIIYLVRGLDIFWIMFIVLIFKHTMNNLAGKLKEVNFVLDYLELTVNILFNLCIVYFFHSFWLYLLAI